MRKIPPRRLVDPEKDFQAYGEPLLSDPRFERLRTLTHHGNVSAYDHCLSVAKEALDYCCRHHLKVEPSTLIRSALLHDYFLYDWHIKPHPKHHATMHGVYAARNAMRDFGLNPIERNAIESHMWPVCLFHLPIYREARIVQAADKRVTWKEFVRRLQKKKTA